MQMHQSTVLLSYPRNNDTKINGRGGEIQNEDRYKCQQQKIRDEVNLM